MKNNTDIVKYEKDKCIIRATEDNLDIIKENIFKYVKPDNIAGFLSEINKSGMYRFINNPKGGYLYKYSDGTVSGVWRNSDTGKILEHGQLKEAGIDIGNVCKAAANQAMFAYIIVQLDEINQKLDLILEGQHNDRIAKIEGAIRAYEHLDGRDSGIIDNIVLQLETGITELEKELNQLSNKLDPKVKLLDNLISSKEKEIEKIHKQFVEDIGYIFQGYQTLMKIDVKIGKTTGAEHLIEFLETGKWKELTELARCLPYIKSEFGYPEDRWEKIDTEKPVMIKNLRNMIDFEKKKVNEYIIEFKGKHLLEALK